MRNTVLAMLLLYAPSGWAACDVGTNGTAWALLVNEPSGIAVFSGHLDDDWLISGSIELSANDGTPLGSVVFPRQEGFRMPPAVITLPDFGISGLELQGQWGDLHSNTAGICGDANWGLDTRSAIYTDGTITLQLHVTFYDT